MALSDPLPIRPFTKPVRGEVNLPGSKSLTNRALLLAALCEGPVTLTGALFSDDTRLMAEALVRLGIAVESDEARGIIRVTGAGGHIPAETADLFVGLAGTAARFLTALCAAAPRGVYRIDGVPQMRKRPMKGLFDALVSQGADIRYLGDPGFFPVEIHARGLKGGPVTIDASESSQMLSALLMVAPLARTEMLVSTAGSLREPFVQMTSELMHLFGQPEHGFTYRSGQPLKIHLGRYRLPGGTYAVEPDATAASYFLALPAMYRSPESHVIVPKIFLSSSGPLRLLQGDTKFARAIEKLGFYFENLPTGTRVFWRGSPAQKRGVTPNSYTQSFREYSDTFLTLAAITPVLGMLLPNIESFVISGIAHTRKQETNRVAGMASELSKLGQKVEETDDALQIWPAPLKPGVEIETYHDHRFAMSFAILGCYDLLGNGIPWLSIKNPGCCAKTFPDFFDVLGQLWSQSHSH